MNGNFQKSFKDKIQSCHHRSILIITILKFDFYLFIFFTSTCIQYMFGQIIISFQIMSIDMVYVYIMMTNLHGICINDEKLTILILFIFQVIFITEYMSSGSLSQFMKKTRKNNKTFNLKVL